jgi:hypothetical protein
MIKISSDDLKLLIYLNINELKSICNKFNIEYHIYIEKNNNIVKTSEIDHKIFIINNIKKYFQNKNPTKTIYKKHIINYENIINLTEDSYIYYPQYKTTNKNILTLMKNLTKNKFKFGAISQKIIRTIWRKNKLITYKEFAKLWMEEFDKSDSIEYPELAYNQFMKEKGDKNKWHENKKNVILLFNEKYNLFH